MFYYLMTQRFLVNYPHLTLDRKDNQIYSVISKKLYLNFLKVQVVYANYELKSFTKSQTGFQNILQKSWTELSWRLYPINSSTTKCMDAIPISVVFDHFYVSPLLHPIPSTFQANQVRFKITLCVSEICRNIFAHTHPFL